MEGQQKKGVEGIGRENQVKLEKEKERNSNESNSQRYISTIFFQSTKKLHPRSTST